MKNLLLTLLLLPALACPYNAAYHAEPDITSSQVGAALVAARAPG